MRSGVTRDCLNCMGKLPVDRERLTVVVIMGRIVAETSFRRNVGIGSRSHCLLGEARKSLAIKLFKFEQISKFAAKMEARIILFQFFEVENDSIVFLTHTSIGVDTKIAGLTRIQAELFMV